MRCLSWFAWRCLFCGKWMKNGEDWNVWRSWRFACSHPSASGSKFGDCHPCHPAVRPQRQGGRFAKIQNWSRRNCNVHYATGTGYFTPTVVCLTCTDTPSDVANKSWRLTHTHAYRITGACWKNLKTHPDKLSLRTFTCVHMYSVHSLCHTIPYLFNSV